MPHAPDRLQLLQVLCSVLVGAFGGSWMQGYRRLSCLLTVECWDRGRGKEYGETDTDAKTAYPENYWKVKASSVIYGGSEGFDLINQSTKKLNGYSCSPAPVEVRTMRNRNK